MASIMRMPELAANTTEATLTEWLVPEQSTVAIGDLIATVETDKASVDVEAETEGVVLRFVVEAGSNVEVGAPIAVIGALGENIDGFDLSSGNVQSNETNTPVDSAAVEVENEETHSSMHEAESSTPNLGKVPGAADQSNRGRIFASPLARKISRDAGLELAQMRGTGPGGRIVRRDVAAALEERTTSADAAPPTPTKQADTTSTHTISHARDATVEGNDVPHTRLRRTIAARLTESKHSAPHFYLRGTAKVDALLTLRAQINEVSNSRISVNDLIVKAVANTHRAIPEMNVIWTPDSVRRFTSVDVAVAVATEDGLMTPVVRAADSISLSTLSALTSDFAKRARSGKLRPHELEGGTITVTNLGMYGTEDFSAIINPPHSSILAVGAAKESAVVEDGELVVARIMHFTLSVDHRPVDGAVAARWMREFIASIEKPLGIVA